MSQLMLPVEDAIYKRRNVVKGSYYSKCVEKDIISVILPIMKQMGFYFSYEGVFKRLAVAVGLDTPWHHVRHLKTKRCGIDHNLKFNRFGYVPPRCMECWKVVVGPRTLKELFLLLDIEKDLDRPSKCGIELRHYTPKHYGGYFYNSSLDEGRGCYEIVRKAVDEHISPEVGIILKRGCTEYEMALGPSAMWYISDKFWDLDKRIEAIVDPYSPNAEGQTEECLAMVHSHWIEWAWRNMDKTADEYLGGMPLYPETMKYHEGNISEIKLDLMRAKAHKKYDIAPEVVDSIHIAMRGFDMTKRVSLKKMGAVLGFDSINPLFAGEEDTI